MPALPPITDLTDSATSEAQAKTWFLNLRAYLVGLLGSTGVNSDALATLLGGGRVPTASMPTTPYITGDVFLEVSDYPALTVSAANTYDISAFCGGAGGNTSLATQAYTAAITYTIPNNISGTARFNASHRSSTSGQTVYLQLLKNGNVVNTWTTSLISAEARTADVLISPGDVIVWQHMAQNSGVWTTVESIAANASKGYKTMTAYKQLP